MMENGKMEGNMEKENIFLKQDNSEKAFGKVEKESSGWMTYKMTICD